jgi:hypothetical protein
MAKALRSLQNYLRFGFHAVPINTCYGSRTVFRSFKMESVQSYFSLLICRSSVVTNGGSRSSSQGPLVTFEPINTLFQIIAVQHPDISQLLPYEYRPLQTPRTIRVLELAPGSDDDPLTCVLTHVNLDDAPKYIGLSYTWEDSQKRQNIRIGDSRLSITDSLHSALKDVRACDMRRDRNQILWADALCINQDNVTERNQQVAIMGDIYRRAFAVITYIGPETDDSRAALRLAQSLQEFSERRGGGTWRDAHDMLEENFARHGFPPAQDPTWNALRLLMNRPWSSRVWIVQESLLNENLLMLCGRTAISWGLLGTLAHLSVNSRIPRLHTGNFGRGMDLLIAQNNLHNYAKDESHQQDTFYELLRMCHPFLSSDPRDKVFAMLGVARDGEKVGIVPDYNEPAESVYTNVAIRLIQVYPTLDLFSSVYVDKDKSIPLPTWVPDWSTFPESPYEPFVNHPILPRYGLNRASADSPSHFEFSADHTQLSVKGAIIDHISHVDDKIAAHEAGLTGVFACFPFLIDQLDRLSTLPLYAQGDHSNIATGKTLLQDILRCHCDPAHPSFAESFIEAGLRLDAALSGRSDISTSVNPNKLKMLQELVAAFHSTVANRRFFATQQGFIGLGPPNTHPGDLACILLGGRFPFVLREAGRNFELIGESYVHGMMKGEAFELEDFVLRMLTLV